MELRKLLANNEHLLRWFRREFLVFNKRFVPIFGKNTPKIDFFRAKSLNVEIVSQRGYMSHFRIIDFFNRWNGILGAGF